MHCKTSWCCVCREFSAGIFCSVLLLWNWSKTNVLLVVFEHHGAHRPCMHLKAEILCVSRVVSFFPGFIKPCSERKL